MPKEVVTPVQKRRGRPPASASNTPRETATPIPRSRSARKAIEKPSSSKKKKDEEEQRQADSSSDVDEAGPSSRRGPKKRGEKKIDKGVPSNVAAPESEDEVQLVKTVKAKNRPKGAGSPRVPAAALVKEEQEEEEVEESQTPSMPATRREKLPETRGKMTRGRAETNAAPAEEQGKRTASRNTRQMKKVVEEEEEVQVVKRSTSRAMHKGKKGAESEEEEEEAIMTKRPASRSARKGNDVPEDEEEVVEPVKNKRTAVGRPAKKVRKETASDDDDEGQEEEPAKSKRATASRRGKNAEEQEEEATNVRTAPRPTRKGRKAEENGEEEEEQAVKGSKATRWARKGNTVVDADEEAERQRTAKAATRSTRQGKKGENAEEEDKEVEKKKKKGKGGRGDDGEEGTSRSRARRRLNLNEEEEQLEEEEGEGRKTMRSDKELLPMEPERPKTKEERLAERAARRAAAHANDPPEADDVKPLVPVKPAFVNDATNFKEESVNGSDDEITVVGTVGIPTASDVGSKPKDASMNALVAQVRTACRSVYESKDERTFRNSANSLCSGQNAAYAREHDYSEVVAIFYNEIGRQMTHMFMKDVGETKEETECKRRVIRVIAMAQIQDLKDDVPSSDYYEQIWEQIDYLLNKFATAIDPHIRVNCCHWIADLIEYSKEYQTKEWARLDVDEREEEQRRIMQDEWARPGGAKYGVDNDQRIVDGHVLKLINRKRLYFGIYQALKHEEPIVRIAAIQALSRMQDDPIPAAFTAALEHTPKDLITRQLMDIHVSVRKVAIEELRPSSDQHIDALLKAALQEKHDTVRKEAFRQLGRLKIGQFTLAQRHALLGMLRDNILGVTVEKQVLHSWLHEMVTGENPRPIVFATPKKAEDETATMRNGKRRSAPVNEVEMRERWAAAPLRLLAYLDCINKTDDVLWILRKGSAIARKESGNGMLGVSLWISAVIDECGRQGLAQITMTEYNHLLDRDMSDEARATVVTFWQHCLQFIIENKKDEGDRYDGLNQLSPSMADLRELVVNLLDDERERREPRKKLLKKGDLDVTHPACAPTAAPLQAIVAQLLASLHFLNDEGDDEAKNEWKQLLMTLALGDLCDLSPAIWKVVMHDLLTYHSSERVRDDLIYDLARKMGFNFEEFVKGKAGSPKRQSKSPSKKAVDRPSTPTSSKKKEEEKRVDVRKFVLSRPDILGLLSGALKTNYFTENDESFSIVFKAELDAYRCVSDNHLQSACLECIGMFGIYSAEIAERYGGQVMENILKSADEDDDQEDGRCADDERIRKRRKKGGGHLPDELEMDYKRREKEERERREAEQRSREGGRNHCRGLAVSVMADLIVAHSLAKVDKWLAAEKYTALGLFSRMEALATEPDLELAFKVAVATFKLVLHDRELLKHLNRAVALLLFRAMHPSSFAHSLYRSCVLQFLHHFGSRSKENQMALTEVVVEMQSLIKMRSLDYKEIVDRGGNAYLAFFIITSSFAPSALKIKDGLRTATAHAVLLKKLGEYLDRCEHDARADVKVDMDEYKGVLQAILGMEFSKMNATSIRGIYNVLNNNVDLVNKWDTGNEATKLTRRAIKRVDEALLVINEIQRLTKLLGKPIEDKDTYLPYDDDVDQELRELRERARLMGVEMPPEKECGRTPMATPSAKRRGGQLDMRGLMSTLKKEPARSKSLAATAAAERREAKAAASSSNTQAAPSRSSTRLRQTRKRAAPLSTIDESDTD